MATLSSIVNAIKGVLQDPAYTDPVLVDHINEAIQNIAAGIRLPNGEISPPLPDLYCSDELNTDITLPYISLPSNYQRNVFKVYDNTLYEILPPRGGDYYAYGRFLKQINQLNLRETGEIYRVCVKGLNLYYQGIPSVSTILGVHYCRKPVLLTLDGDIPEGIPDHLQESILKHYVCKNIFGEKIEDGQDNKGIGTTYHTTKFYEDMNGLVDFIGRDSEPMYYGSDEGEDRGRCDG